MFFLLLCVLILCLENILLIYLLHLINFISNNIPLRSGCKFGKNQELCVNDDWKYSKFASSQKRSYTV